MNDEEVKNLKNRLADLELMIASIASQVAQLKECDHFWVDANLPLYILNNPSCLIYECSKCGMRKTIDEY